MMRGRKRRSPPQVSGGDGAAIDGKGETTEVDDTTPQDDMQDRQELIPPDLAPRITQMVVDDLRAAGWTVEPPPMSAKERAALVTWKPSIRDGNPRDPDEVDHDWYVNRRDSYRAAKNEPCRHQWRQGATGGGSCVLCGMTRQGIEHALPVAEPHVHTWTPINIIGRAQEVCYGCDAVRDAPVAKPCAHPRTRRSASFDGHLICLSCGENLDLSGS
jgi:hypothetical protein